MKRFTVGITTHNEEPTIARLLDSLSKLSPDEADIILFDDCSSDSTKAIVQGHKIASQPNFRSHFAVTNNGTPSVGRTYIGQNAKTEYVTLIDGDDFIDLAEYRKFIDEAPSGYDILISTYSLRDKVRRLDAESGELSITNATISRVLSGIGGKSYKTSLLKDHGPDPVVGRSDDVRLNMRILLAIKPSIWHAPDTCYYVVEQSRKSGKLSTLNFKEIEARVQNYIRLQSSYPIDRRYLMELKRNTTSIINADQAVGEIEREKLLETCNSIFSFSLKRIVWLVIDISAVGGISGRLRKVQRGSAGRDVQHIFLTKNAAPNSSPDSLIVYSADPKTALDTIAEWSESDTVILSANNIMAGFPREVAKALSRFPLIYMSSGQMAFFIQDSVALTDLDYVRNFRASALIALSDMDISFQRQLGIHGQVKGFLPVEVRPENTFDPERNKYLGYVGRVDFHSKDCEQLVGIGRAFKEAGLPPIKLFTTGAKNSPDYQRLMDQISEADLLDQFDIVLDCTDRDIIYREIGMLVLPSKKESFGNVILEAYSYGIPVIAAEYAPGPSELIVDGETGYLVSDFKGTRIAQLFADTQGERMAVMSAAAFERHKNYSMEKHLDFIESLAADVLQKFDGKNTMQVYPELKMVRGITSPQKPEKNLSALKSLVITSRRSLASKATQKIRDEISNIAEQISKLQEPRSSRRRFK